MARRKPTPRFEVTINGRRACVSGIVGYGVMNVIVGRVKRNPKRFPGKGQVRFSKSEWSREELDIQVGGLDVNGTDEHLHWLRRGIRLGDEIVVRVLGQGPIDKPKSLGRRRLTTRSTRTRAKGARR